MTSALTDRDAAEFLRWALPRLGLCWKGFRKVRRQVRRRIVRRLGELDVLDLRSYRDRLAGEPEEWRVLDGLCRITISRFYRERGTFDRLRDELPRGAHLRVWSAGAGSGEEPYSLVLFGCLARPDLRMEITASEADPLLLARAREARYRGSSLRELPREWVSRAFERVGEEFELRPEFRGGVEWRLEDIRRTMPEGPFDIVFCRYLAFTYFDEEVRQRVLDSIRARIRGDGLLVVGTKETLPGIPGDRATRPIHRMVPGAGDRER